MPVKYRIGTVAMCDAVYKDERTNKAILAGLYSGNVLAEHFPLELPASFYVELTPDVGGAHEVELKFFKGGKHFMGAIVELRDTIAGTPAMLLLPGLSMRFEKPCQLDVKLCAEGAKPVTIFTKAITAHDTTLSVKPPRQ